MKPPSSQDNLKEAARDWALVPSNTSFPDWYNRAWLSSNATSPSNPYGTIVDATGDFADHRMRNINRKSVIDVPPAIHSKAQQISLWLFDTNPMAKRIVNVYRDYIIGDGMEFRAEDPEVQGALEQFWTRNDPDWDERSFYFVQDLSVFGEQALTFVTHDDGFLEVQNLLPLMIKQTVSDETDRSRILRIILQESALTNSGDPKELEKLRDISLYRRNEKGLLEGEGVFFKINDIAHSGRGLPDLFASNDWIDIADFFLFNVSEKMEYLNRYFLDVTIEGGQEDDIRAYRQEFANNRLNPGSIIVHNDQVKHNFISPDQRMDDVSALMKEMRNQIFIATGINSLLAGDPSGSLGRQATPEVMDSIFRSFKSRQRQISGFFRRMFNIQIDAKIKVGQLDPKVNKKLNIFMPRVAIRDLQRLGGVVQRIALAVSTAVQEELLEPEEGSLILRAILDDMGLGIHLKTSPESSGDAAETAAKIKEILEEKEIWQTLHNPSVVDGLLERLGEKGKDWRLRRDLELVR